MPNFKTNKKLQHKKDSRQTLNNRPTKSQLRIIGGQFRGRKLSFESAQGLRPTLDQVRETLFNWLSADIHEAKCLDLFAGSGALGFEALSRGAASITFVDNNTNAINNIQNNLHILCANQLKNQSHCIKQTAEHFLKNTNEQYDIVFLDPPYELGFIKRTLEKLQPVLAPNALIYIEMESSLPIEFLNNAWQTIKMKSSSRLSYGLIRQKK